MSSVLLEGFTMPDHPSTAEFQAFLRMASRPAEATANARIVRHLLAGCFACHQQLGEMGWNRARLDRLLRLRGKALAEQDESAGSAEYDYTPAFAATERALNAFFAKDRPPAAPIETLWAELSSLSSEEQIRRVGTDERFASPELIRQMIQGSQSVRFDDPDKILHLAHLACLAAESCSAEETGSRERLADLRSQAWRQYANALRVQARLRESEAAFARAQRYGEEGTGDPTVRAKLLAQMVSLRIFQRRFDDAIRLAEEAGRIYKEIEQTNAFASTLVQKAVATLYAGDPETAARTLNRAIPLIDPAGDPHLLLAACHNLVRCYIDLERPEQALSLYFEAQELYQEFQDSLILLRAGWQEGQLLRDLGHLHAAEAALTYARDGFAKQELLGETALVSLDLAAVYVHLGDAEKLRDIVATTVPICRALGVDREALASLLQLQQLAGHGRQAFELIRLLSSSIERLGRSAGR
jgi:tetratricopeptide (TPR) repeat protein